MQRLSLIPVCTIRAVALIKAEIIAFLFSALAREETSEVLLTAGGYTVFHYLYGVCPRLKNTTRRSYPAGDLEV